MQVYRIIVLLVSLVGLASNGAGFMDVLRDVYGLRKRREFYGSYRTNALEQLADESVMLFVQVVLVIVGFLAVFQISMPILLRSLLLLTSLLVTVRGFNKARARTRWREQWHREHDGQ